MVTHGIVTRHSGMTAPAAPTHAVTAAGVSLAAAERTRHARTAAAGSVTTRVRGWRGGVAATTGIFLLVICPQTRNENKDNKQTEDFFHRLVDRHEWNKTSEG